MQRITLPTLGVFIALSVSAVTGCSAPAQGNSSASASASASSTSASASPAAESSTPPPTPPSITWQKQKSSKHTEDVSIPVLHHADAAVTKRFDAEVQRQVNDARDIAEPSKNSNCSVQCSLIVKTGPSFIRDGRFASVSGSMYPYPGGVHPMGLPLSFTVDLVTGDILDLHNFVSASDTSIVESLEHALAKKGISPSEGVPLDRAAWNLTKNGITFTFAQGVVSDEASGIISTALPTSAVAPSSTPADQALSLEAPTNATLSWTTIRRDEPTLHDYKERLQVPVIKGADDKAAAAFDHEISRQVAAMRDYTKPTSGKSDCYAPPTTSTTKITGSIYQGSYASAVGNLEGNTCNDFHSYLGTFDATVDLRTGLLVDQHTFNTGHAQPLQKALEKEFSKQPIWKFAELHITDLTPGWAASDAGMTFAVNEGVEASLTTHATVPWSVVRG